MTPANNRKGTGQFAKGASGNPAGRPPGVPNRTTKAIREAFVEVFDELGGVPAMVRWARSGKNRGAFYALVARILPREVESPAGGFRLVVVKDYTGDRVPREVDEAEPPSFQSGAK